MTLTRLLAVLLALALAGCTTGGPPPAPTYTLPPPGPGISLTPTGASGPQPPAATPGAPASGELTPAPALDFTPGPYATPTLEQRPPNCLRPGDYEPMVEQYLQRQGYPDLKTLWETFDEDTPIYGLNSSFTDITNTYAHSTTFSKMLLVGEYKAAVNRPDAVGYVHCAVLIYRSGDEPEIGVGILDANLNGAWSGYAYGLARSEQELRQFVQQRIGKAVIVRYHVSQDPNDASFVRNGFFSPVMRLLWQDSYYVRFSQNPDMLKDNIGQPRGPSMQELMTLMTEWPNDLGLFLDYVTDPIL